MAMRYLLLEQWVLCGLAGVLLLRRVLVECGKQKVLPELPFQQMSF